MNGRDGSSRPILQKNADVVSSALCSYDERDSVSRETRGTYGHSSTVLILGMPTSTCFERPAHKATYGTVVHPGSSPGSYAVAGSFCSRIACLSNRAQRELRKCAED